jgi:hypothetical protein
VIKRMDFVNKFWIRDTLAGRTVEDLDADHLRTVMKFIFTKELPHASQKQT